MDYLAACCIFKDEERYLREWVEYHRLAGVERFYLICNGDSPEAARSILLPYLQSGEVLLEWRPGGPFAPLQPQLYVDAIVAFRGKARWLAFLDVDEFLLPVGANGIPEILASYEKFAALAVNWACFGSSGLLEAPPAQTAAYRWRARDDWEDNRVYKSIVDPMQVVASYNPHCFRLRDNAALVDESGAPVTHPWRNENPAFFGSRLRLNHYRTRSAAEFAEKIARWRGGGHPDFADAGAVERYWKRHDLNEVRDEAIQRFVPELLRRLA